VQLFFLSKTVAAEHARATGELKLLQIKHFDGNISSDKSIADWKFGCSSDRVVRATQDWLARGKGSSENRIWP
jgi:hypothetical protein